MRTFKQFLISMKNYRFRVIISVVLAVGSAVLTIFIPKILGDMTNIAVETYPNIDFAAVAQKAIIVVVLFVVAAGLNYAQAYILTIVAARYTQELRNKISLRLRGYQFHILININTVTLCRECQMTLMYWRLRCRKKLLMYL